MSSHCCQRQPRAKLSELGASIAIKLNTLYLSDRAILLRSGSLLAALVVAVAACSEGDQVIPEAIPSSSEDREAAERVESTRHPSSMKSGEPINQEEARPKPTRPGLTDEANMTDPDSQEGTVGTTSQLGESGEKKRFELASVSAGPVHSSGVRRNSAVACWGSNEDILGNFAGQATPPREVRFRQRRDFSQLRVEARWLR